EKMPNTTGTMFNSQIYIAPDGTLIGKHQKIMPTVGERLVHMGGFGDTFGAFDSEFGPMSGLICGENSNPLAVFALMSKAFVISACGTVDEQMIEMLKTGPEGEKFLRDPNCCGGSLIVDPF